MNERERRANQSLRTLDEAHRNGRITRGDYRARRRALLGSLCDSDGITARNVLTPAAAAPPHGGDAKHMAAPAVDMAGALFPDRRRLAWRLWLMAFAGLGLGALLLYALLLAGRG